MRLPRKFSLAARKTFIIIHLWTGLFLGLWFVAIGLTGTVLAYRSECYAFEARKRVGAPNPAPGAKIIPPSQAIAAFKAAFPGIKPERSLYIPSRKMEFRLYRVNARGELNGKRASLIYLVDPVSGKAYPPIDRDSMWTHTFETFHVDLLGGVKGAVTNGVFSFLSLFLLLSGLWLWWPSNIKQLKERLGIKFGSSMRRTLYDLHNALGVYLYGLLLLLSLTAVLLVIDGQTGKSLAKAIDRRAGVQPAAVGRRAPRSLSGGKMPVVKPVGQPLGVDELVEKAKAAVPGKNLVVIRLPARPGQPFQGSFDPLGFNNGVVFFNPYTGEKIDFDEPTHAPGAWAMKVVGNLHFGWFGGAWSQFLYGLAGILPLGLFITGTWMWINKKRSELKLKAKRRAKATAQQEAATATAATP